MADELSIEPGAGTPADVLRYVQHAVRFCCAQGARLLVDGAQAYPEMLRAIDKASCCVDLETFILTADATGRRFAQALMAAARRGVAVRLMYDWIGSYSLPAAFVRELLDAGVDVRVYHPLVWRRPSWAINRRSHRKLLIVDRGVGFTGGLNIGDDYAPIDQGGKGWRDTHVLLEGAQMARRLEAAFNYAWTLATPYDASRKPTQRVRLGLRHIGPRLRGRLRREVGAAIANGGPVCEAGGIAVKILGNEEFRFRRRIHRAYLHAISRATRYVLIENAYFIPNRSVRRALRKAAARGVTVAVVLARHSDVPITTYASRYLYRELLRGGVRIFEWQDGMMHAKTAVIDDAWSIVGSYNFDHRSLLHQLELAALIADGPFAATLRDRTLADLARCREVNLAEHNRRPWHQRALEWLAYLVRSLL